MPSSLSLLTSYLWGLDLGGSLQGAGGVGGLLAVTTRSGLTAYPAFDGNGNVMGYYDATTAESVAEFEYGPFGELIRETGSHADAFRFRFSTKFQDAETGLLYYGFRFLNPETGRWLNRDSIGELGGLNLYGFVRNDGVNGWDYLGMVSPGTVGEFLEVWRRNETLTDNVDYALNFFDANKKLLKEISDTKGMIDDAAVIGALTLALIETRNESALKELAEFIGEKAFDRMIDRLLGSVPGGRVFFDGSVGLGASAGTLIADTLETKNKKNKTSTKMVTFQGVHYPKSP